MAESDNSLLETQSGLVEQKRIDRILEMFDLDEDHQASQLTWLLQVAADRGDPESQHLAVWALGQLHVESGDIPAVLQALLANLSATDVWVRGESATSLSDMCERHLSHISETDQQVVVNALLALSRDPNPWLRQRGLRALLPWRHQAMAQRAFEQAFLDTVPMVREASMRTGLDIAHHLEQGLTDEDPDIRLTATGRIRNLNPTVHPHLYSLLLERLHDPYAMVISDALMQLEHSHRPEFAPAILELLDFGWTDPVRNAIHELTGKSVEEVIAETKWQPSKEFRTNARVRQRTQQEVSQLLEKVSSPQVHDKESAIAELTWVLTDEASHAWAQTLGDTDPFIRFMTLDAIYRRVNILFSSSITSELYATLLPLLHDSHVHVAIRAANVWEMLLIGNQSPNKEVRENVLRALRDLATHHRSGLVRLAASKALLKGGFRDREFWTARLGDRFVRVREAAAFGIKGIRQ